MTNKKKIITAIAASVTALALLAGGTFAWQSISQTALNEKEATINPGGRLHDDFNGKNKDVYVENFADNDIYARVRLDEYFEIVMNKGTPVATTEVITEGATKEDVSTYIPHKFEVDNTTDVYWNWITGGSTKYMPTFNMNKDSLVADINGTFKNDYEDYVDYTDEVNSEKTATEIYDGDSNDIDEVGSDFDNLEAYADNIKTIEEQTHTVKETVECKGLISIEEWLELEDNTDNYWVYDNDGWVYWSSPIASNTATGLLLDEIELTNVMDDSYYYAINVVGQFITADDLGKDDNTGFYADGETVSDNALTLLERIGVTVPQDDVDDPWAPSPLDVRAAADKTWYEEGSAVENSTITASATFDDVALSDEDLGSVVWSISGNTSSNTTLSATTGKSTTLTIASDETGTIVVVAKLAYLGEEEQGSAVITNGPNIGSMVVYDENNNYISSGTYTAGKANVYTVRFYEEYLGDISRYDPENAYTGHAKDLILESFKCILVSNGDDYNAEESIVKEGVTFEQTSDTFTLTIEESFSEPLYVLYKTSGTMSIIKLDPQE